MVTGALPMDTEAIAATVGSAMLRARTETGFIAGTFMGAVYTACPGLAEPAMIVPTVALPPAMPLTSQLTAVFNVPVTVAVNAMLLPSATTATLGEIVTVTAGLMDTVREAVFDGSATAVAVIVT